MNSLLLLGFLIGMRHALDADHLAAVAAISTRRNSIRATMHHGAVWGLGHTLTLFLFGSTVIWLDTLSGPTHVRRSFNPWPGYGSNRGAPRRRR